MGKRVAIIGIGLTNLEGREDLSHKELLFQATRRALTDAGISRNDIGSAFTTSYDLLEGRSLSNQFSLDAIGGVMKPCDLRLGEDGIYGVCAAYMEVMAKPSDIVVVGSVQKASERREKENAFQNIVLASLEPVYNRPVCNTVPISGLEYALAAMEARWYLHRYGISEEQTAKVAAKNHKNATKNPRAKNAKKYSVKDVLNSEVLSWPIKRLEAAEMTDAACALVIASEEVAKRITDKPVWITGVGWCSGTSYIESRDLSSSPYIRAAAQHAYNMAGIKHPAKEIDVAEIYDTYAYKELQYYEALGFCGEGGAGRLIDEGITELGGALPVNPSGGLLGEGNAVGTSGLIRAAYAAYQVRGEAGDFQVPGVEVAVAQGWGGIPTYCGGVVVLSRW
jgi:acetyl-CoA C-acetyltransferase